MKEQEPQLEPEKEKVIFPESPWEKEWREYEEREFGRKKKEMSIFPGVEEASQYLKAVSQ